MTSARLAVYFLLALHLPSTPFSSRKVPSMRLLVTRPRDDAEAFAESLAAAFRLHLERRTDGTLILHASPPPDPDS